MGASERNIAGARFWKKFWRLTRGRVPVLRALEVIGEEEADAGLKQTLHSLGEAMEQGSTLSEATERFPAEFSRSVVELIRTAEKTGAWDEIVAEIIGGLEDGTFD